MTTAQPQSSWQPSIRLLVSAIVLAPIVLVSLVLVWLLWRSTERIADSLAQSTMSAAASSVAGEVRNYLDDAVRVSDRYTRRVESGHLPDPPAQAWERAMLDDLATTPSVASICYGNVNGDATWLLRAHGRLEVGRVEAGHNDRVVEYQMDAATGGTIGGALRTYSYDSRQRPWWAIAMREPQPTWTPIYTWFPEDFAEASVGTGYVRQIHKADGTVAGVLVVDITLGAVNTFLGKLTLAQQGQAFIIDEKDHLVASSSGRVIDDAGNPLPRSAPPARLKMDGVPARATVVPFAPFPGISWRVVTVLPESAFTVDSQRVRTRAIVASLVAATVGLLLGLLLTRKLTRPISATVLHVQRVAKGDFDQRLSIGGARELAILSREINRMTDGLRDRIALEQSLAVAMEVQQSLLPAGDPVSEHFDIAGRSMYCDQTGGDYFDFIQVRNVSRSSMLIAVGDVMGHGIAAALLMATARAALHCAAIEPHSIGALMTRINDVLAANNRHNRFMTLTLLELDAGANVARWSSAGHDPAIVYDPKGDVFREFEGGDLPLGVTTGVDYIEYDSPLPGSGAVLLIGTDGVWEMRDEHGGMYGKDRVRDVVRQHHAESAKAIAAALEANLARFRGSCSSLDDVTFVIVKVRPRECSEGALVQ